MAVNNGLYNMLFSENEHADKLLDLLDIDREMFGRYRDCYLNEDGTKIIVLTRCGGSNRNDYEIVFDTMRRHDWYETDYDDPKDETYCYFIFDVPVLFYPQIKPLSTGIKPLSVSEKFDKEIKEMKIPGSEAEKHAKVIANYLQKAIDENPNGGIIYMGDPDWKKGKK